MKLLCLVVPNNASLPHTSLPLSHPPLASKRLLLHGSTPCLHEPAAAPPYCTPSHCHQTPLSPVRVPHHSAQHVWPCGALRTWHNSNRFHPSPNSKQSQSPCDLQSNPAPSKSAQPCPPPAQSHKLCAPHRSGLGRPLKWTMLGGWVAIAALWEQSAMVVCFFQYDYALPGVISQRNQQQSGYRQKDLFKADQFSISN